MTRLIVLTGPSGAGKSTVLERLLKRPALRLVRFVTTTTRPRRPGERNGRDYWFTDEKTFLAKRRRGAFYESADVYGCWYGSDRQEMHRLKRLGRPVIMILDVTGARTMKRMEPDSLIIFFDAPKRELLRRLKARGTSLNNVKRRIAAISREEDRKRFADVYIRNGRDDLASSVRATVKAIKASTPKK